jgi:hypothetical protein
MYDSGLLGDHGRVGCRYFEPTPPEAIGQWRRLRDDFEKMAESYGAEESIPARFL